MARRWPGSRRRAPPLPVASARGLAEALADLLAPDRVARLAHAGWAVASEGTEVTDRMVALAGRLVEREA